MAMAARRPAPPPPTIRTSCAARMTLSLTAPLLVRQHLPVVVDDHAMAAAVVELFPGAPAPAGVPQVLGHQTLVVLGQVLLAAVPVSARCEPWFKSSSGGTHGPSPFGAGTVTSDQQDEPAPHRPDCEGLPLTWWVTYRATHCRSPRRATWPGIALQRAGARWGTAHVAVADPGSTGWRTWRSPWP